MATREQARHLSVHPLHGELVGEDAAGNHYYRRGTPRTGAPSGAGWSMPDDIEIDGSMVPPGWHAWLGRSREKAPSEEPLPTKRGKRSTSANLSGSLARLRAAGA